MLATIAVLSAPAERPRAIVRLASGGVLRGRVGLNGERQFLGVPYAAPPVGDRRFRPPQEAPPWRGIRDATSFGKPCLQPQYPRGGWASIENTANASEDCLYLNVVAPARLVEQDDSKKPAPVVVYLPAGEFHYGAGSDRENDWPFFADDVVFVTVNYRLGALGFLGGDALRTRSPNNGTGNYGILDQRFALQWVRANIAAFGGDPHNVALMGESSGGTSVGIHLVTKPSWGLFHKAILQSPGLTQVKKHADAELNVQYLLAALSGLYPQCKPGRGFVAFEGAGLYESPFRTTEDMNASAAQAFCEANALFCHAYKIEAGTDPANRSKSTASFYARISIMNDERSYLAERGGSVTVYARAGAGGAAGAACLAAADAAHLNEITQAMPRDDTFETDAWAPVVDGVDMPTTVIEGFQSGATAPGVPVLLGSNLDEGTEFMYLAPPLDCTADAAQFSTWALAFYGATLGPDVVQAYQTLEQPLPPCIPHHHHGTPPPPPPPTPSPNKDYGRYYMAAMRSAGDVSITCRVRQVALGLAQRGGSVYNYFFRHAPAFSVNWQNTTGYGAYHGAEVPFVFGDAFELNTTAEVALSQRMGAYWRNFVHSSDPNTGPAATAGRWERFGANESAQLTLQFDTQAREPAIALKRDKCDAFSFSS